VRCSLFSSQRLPLLPVLVTRLSTSTVFVTFTFFLMLLGKSRLRFLAPLNWSPLPPALLFLAPGRAALRFPSISPHSAVPQPLTFAHPIMSRYPSPTTRSLFGQNECFYRLIGNFRGPLRGRKSLLFLFLHSFPCMIPTPA